MKKFAFLMCAYMAIAGSLTAVEQLPPLFQDLRELRSILTSDNLGKILPAGDTIMEVKKVDGGYIIKTNKHQVVVQVTYQSGQIGPVPFTIEFLNPEPLNLNSKR